MFKKYLLLFFTGASVGALISGFISPYIISWYAEPPAGFGISCRLPIEWAMRRLQFAQLAGMITGGILIVSIFAVKKTKTDPVPTKSESSN